MPSLSAKIEKIIHANRTKIRCKVCQLILTCSEFTRHVFHEHQDIGINSCVWCFGKCAWIPEAKQFYAKHVYRCYKSYVEAYKIDPGENFIQKLKCEMQNQKEVYDSKLQELERIKQKYITLYQQFKCPDIIYQSHEESDEINQLKKEIKQLKSREAFMFHQNEIIVLKKKVKRLNSEKNSQIQQNDRLQKELKSSKLQLKNEIEKQQKEIIDLKNTMHKQQAIIQEQQQNIQNLQFENDLKTFDEEIYKSQDEIQNLTFQHRLSEYEHEIKDKKQQEIIKKLENYNLKLLQEIETLRPLKTGSPLSI